MLALIPLFPLIGFLINGVWYAGAQAPVGHRKAGALIPGVIATLAIGASFVVSLLLFVQLQGMGEEHRVIEQHLFHWVTIGSGFNLDMAFRLDSLSTLFTLVVTGVGTLIHLYSIGYMGHDATPGKFFSYLNLFCFAMLMLVIGASLPILFLGWEGVGLCSYLLIGYWYTDMDKAKAGKKAFIVNRVGDFGFLLGMFMIFNHFGTLDFAQLHDLIAQGHGAGADVNTLTVICLLLFVGCMGKSAQIPLFVWLPDAMAGPTPVSALIHAATMVTSGVYLVSRLNFMYSLAPLALNVVAVVGAFTAFFAATIAFAQKDIKKVLAYSTISQLGYMFLACGVGAYTAGVFHVITHAFFKALLFLGAGSVIHGMHEQQDITQMGGLRKYMPITYGTWLLGWLAICGVPPFAGFFSKDEILWQAFSAPHGSTALWFMGFLTAIMTAFYMTRLTYLTFWGTERFDAKKIGLSHGHDDHGHGHAGVHESPWAMTVPLIVLAGLSAVGGFMGIPHHAWLEKWLEPVIPVHEGLSGVGAGMEWVLMAASVAGALLGIAIAFNVFKDLAKAAAYKVRFASVYKVLENKWYVDELYEAVIIRPIQALSKGLWKSIDVGVIDRVVVGFGRISEWTGQTVRVIQTGSIQIYALSLMIGVVATVGYLIYGLAK
ncbi:NADH-quinone oxidoreductase subunit L [Bdellovibrionota bacterium FG-1]